MSAADERRVYTVQEFMDRYCISRTRTYAEIGAGRLVARRLGRRTFIARDDADAWVMALPSLRAAKAEEVA